MLLKCGKLVLSILLFFLSSAAWGNPEYVEGEVLVVLDGGRSRVTASGISHGGIRERLNRVASFAQARVVRTYSALSEASGKEVFALFYSEHKTTEALVRELKERPDILAVSPELQGLSS